MRKVVHTKRMLIVLAALIAVALPVTVLFSREGEPAAPRSLRDVAIAADLAAAPVMDVAPVVEWTGDAAQSASMVLVGSLLIGIGSIVRRAL